MKRSVQWLFIATLPLLLLAAAAHDAWAHGGQWRGPGDAIPPGLRQPTDPTPPPPPPPPTPVPTPSPVPTPTSGPVTPGPITPGVPPPSTPTPGSTPTRGSPTPVTYDDWMFWYAYNNAEIENLKWLLYHRAGSSSPLFVTGDGRGLGQRGAETLVTERSVHDIVVPTLLWAMDPKNAGYNDTESAAYIALAKVMRDPVHIQALLAGLDAPKTADALVLEGAALSLGLLRRASLSDQFSARELDRVRARLFEVVDDADFPSRARGFAAVSIGLLGDQPTGTGGTSSDREAAARATTARLFELLGRRNASDDLRVSLLLAVGLQPAGSVTPEQRSVLADCAWKKRLGRWSVGTVTAAHAALALGRIGGAAEIHTLENLLVGGRRISRIVQQSAAIGLGHLGRLLDAPDRVRAAQALLDAMNRAKDLGTHDFGLISLARLLELDAQAKTMDVLRDTRADETLLDEAENGSYLVRGFGALALGLVLRSVGDDLDEPWQTFREKATHLLREKAADRHLDAKSRAAFLTALGIARDAGSRELLRGILADKDQGKMLRGYAALGYGLIGRPTADGVKALAKALAERSSIELRRQAAVALGLLGNPPVDGSARDGIDLLLEELKEARSQAHKGQIVLALARIGDRRALERLVELVRDPREQPLTRALACAGLGLAGDLEWTPSLARVSNDVNYRASCDVLNELLSVL